MIVDTPELIACDVDGTLLFDYAPALPESTVEVIGQLIDRGIAFVPASGRTYGSLCRLFAPLADKLIASPTNMACVAENGTIAYRGGDVVFRSTMERALGETIIRRMLDTDECEAMVSGAHTSYVQPKDPAFPTFLRDVVGFDVTVVDDLTAIDEPFTKISAFYPSYEVDEQRWADWFGDRCAVATGGYGWVDMMPKDTSKAVALAALLELLDVDPAHVMALGDAGNDCEMLRFVGCSVAMETGDSRVKAVADRTAPNAEQEFRRLLACW